MSVEDLPDNSGCRGKFRLIQPVLRILRGMACRNKNGIAFTQGDIQLFRKMHHHVPAWPRPS